MPVATIHPEKPSESEQITQRATELLKQGELVAFPTETVYGVAASARSESAVKALAELAGLDQLKEQQHGFAFHLGDPQHAHKYVDLSHPLMQRAVSKLTPGPVTLVFPMDPEAIEAKMKRLGLPESLRDALFSDAQVRLRCPDHPVAQAILAACEDPVVATVAAKAGKGRAAQDGQEAAEILGESVGLVVDGGRCRYAKPSTVVKLQMGAKGLPAISVLREGVLDERFIRKLLRFTILLVCSGNTCRSPMAEVIARRLLAERFGLPEEDLSLAGLEIVSAGAFTEAGEPAADEAVKAMKEKGMDLSKHRSRRLMPEMIAEADVIYGMSRSHVAAVEQLYPSAGEKTYLLDEDGDITDPIGGSLDVYRQTADKIEQALQKRLDEHALSGQGAQGDG